nr:hypothetical protein [Tanacetum cinerariifolium]
MISIYSLSPLLEYSCRNDQDPSFELLFWIPATCHSKEIRIWPRRIEARAHGEVGLGALVLFRCVCMYRRGLGVRDEFWREGKKLVLPGKVSADRHKVSTVRDSLEGTNGSEGDQVQSPYDSPLLGDHTSDRAEGALNLEELFSICTNLSNMVLALETVKDAQAAKIIALKSRIKKLEKKCKPKEPMNQGSLSEETKELVILLGQEIVLLGQMVSIKDIEDSSRPARSILTLKPLLTIDLKDKGKGVLEEPEHAKKMTISDLDAAQIAKDAEVARLVYEEELAELLKAKTFAEIQGLYERQKMVINDFKPMDLDDAVDKEKVLEEPDNTKIKVKQEGDE